MHGIILLFLAPLMFIAGASLCKIVELTGKVGENITLPISGPNLHGDHQILWSSGSDNRVLYNIDNGTVRTKTSERYSLGPSGSLTIQNLSISDSGAYKGQIINGNGSTHCFNLTVVELDSTQTPAGQSSNHPPHQRNRLGAYVSVGLSTLICFCTVIGAIVINNRGNSPDAKAAAAGNDVV